MDEECCENCRYSKPVDTHLGFVCHRQAPVPYNALAFHFGNMIREIGWILHIQVMGKAPEEDSDLTNETTEAGDHGIWPAVNGDEWCGEWKLRYETPDSAPEEK